ncbi:MAG: hypothetical protein IJ545_06815 [Alphaproteobacteria bacterium]|nr:hypothetical protein [Alphaproteobacteria bacterium]
MSQTDYIDNKVNEALVFGTKEELDEMKAKYKDVVANRRAWRARINELEQMTPEPDDNKKQA